MNWSNCFAQRTNQMKRSAVRELLKITARPEIISFAGGLPAAEHFPVDQVREAAELVLRRQGGTCLQYGETEGVAELRDWIAAAFSRRHLSVERENILITTGAQQALDLLGRVFLERGDQVLVENPTYLALLSAWRPFGIRFRAVPSDNEGLIVNSLETLLEEKPKLVYLVPNFQNPQGTTLTLEKRRKLIESLKKHSIPLIEDDPYGELRYDGAPLPHLFELDASGGIRGVESQVIYVGSFSKVLMPGLRVGWIVAPRGVIEKLVQLKQATDLHTSTLSQYVTLQLLGTGFLDQHLPLLRVHYARRRDAMLGALQKYFPEEAQWTRPEGGMFLLVSLPGHIDTGEVLAEALERRVAFVPGEEFHLDGLGKNTMRLNFSNAQPEQVEVGMKRLGELVKSRCARRN